MPTIINWIKRKLWFSGVTVDAIASTNQTLLMPVTVDVPMPPIRSYVLLDAEFDIENYMIFAIERLDYKTTCIGFILGKHIREWAVQCSKEKHQDFVNRFRKKLKL